MFGWLKRSMPRSLYGRAALILILPVVTVQLIVSVVFLQRHFDGVTRQMTRSVILDLALVIGRVDTGGDAAALAAALDITLAPSPAGSGGDALAFYDLSGRAVIEEVRAGLDGVIAVDVARDRVVAVDVTTRAGPMRLEFDRRRVSASNPHQLLVLMVFVGALMTLVAYLFLRNQLRPIKRLAAASADFGKGRVVPYHPSGAIEVRAAGSAFLDMRNRIQRQTEQRTLMLSGVSHDLRTPLTRLKLGLEMIPGSEAAPLRQDVDDMERMLAGFLDFAKGDAEEARAEVEVSELAGRIADEARRAGHVVEMGMTEGDGTVLVKPMALRRAVGNLIANANRHGSLARLGYAVTERALVISVEDDGPGISLDRREEALRPFSRLDLARNQDQGGGVGLGLAIAADIARSHGGVLRLGESDALGGLKADLVIAR